jgi:hypothetical protein
VRRRFGARGFVALWLVSAAPLFLPGASQSLAPCSVSALWATPWLLYLTAPRARSPRVGSQPGAWGLSLLQVLLALLPLLVLVLCFDRALEGRPIWIGATVLLTALLAAPWILARHLARSSERAERFVSGAWFAIVLGAPLLRASLELGGAPLLGAAPSWLARGLCPLSPLAWLAGRWRRAEDSARFELPLAALCAGIALCIATALVARPRPLLERGDKAGGARA